MLASGNSAPEVCASNLLKITRYEVPYDRIKGMPADLWDMPADEAAVVFVEEGMYNIETYEPRLGGKAVPAFVEAQGSAAGFDIEVDAEDDGLENDDEEDDDE
jgi:hypothetical protein